MRKTIFSFFFILSTSYSHGQVAPNTILWEVSMPGSVNKSYLFGTFHEVNSTFFESLTNSIQMLNNCNKLFVEQRRADFNIKAMQNSELLSWNDSKWNIALNPEQRKVFENFVTKSEDSVYYKMQPLVLSLSLIRLYMQNFCDTINRDSGELMDHYIEKLALTKKMEVFSLDKNIALAFTPTSNSLPDSVNVLTCINLMRKMLDDDASDCDIIRDYKNFKLNYEFEKEIHQQNNVLGLLERNGQWMSVLAKEFKKGNCYVAVGFRHLMYKQGLIQQLRGLGYTVAPVAAR